MTVDEATTVAKLAVAATVRQSTDTEVWEYWLSHLLPLPYASTLGRVSVYVASHKWCSTLSELLDAAGIPEGARADLVRCVREGGRFVPDLRSLSGWSYVPPGAELPRGAQEAAAVAAMPPERAALPPPPRSAEDLAALKERMRAVAEAKRVVERERKERVWREAAALEDELQAHDREFQHQHALAQRSEAMAREEEAEDALPY